MELAGVLSIASVCVCQCVWVCTCVCKCVRVSVFEIVGVLFQCAVCDQRVRCIPSA